MKTDNIESLQPSVVSESTKNNVTVKSPEIISKRNNSVKFSGSLLNSPIKTKIGDVYLKSTSMTAIAGSLELASTVTGFEIVELWTDDRNGNYHCTYAHVLEDLLVQYPQLSCGHHPTHQHLLSPQLCQKALKAENRLHWKTLDDDSPKSKNFLLLNIPIKTELSYYLEGIPDDFNVFLVCLSIKDILFNQNSIKFLSGLGYALYVAAFEHEQPNNNVKSSKDNDDSNNKELDNKTFDPISIISPRPSALNLSEMTSYLESESQKSSKDNLFLHYKSNNRHYDKLMHLNTSQKIPIVDVGVSSKIRTSSDDFLIGLSLSSTPSNSVENLEEFHAEKNSLIGLNSNEKNYDDNNSINTSSIANNIYIDHHDSNKYQALVSSSTVVEITSTQTPTWDPAYSFSYPVSLIPIKYFSPDGLTFNDFKDIKHLVDGSNSNVYTALYMNQKVIIKMIKAEVENEPLAVHEFDLEYGMLSRMIHPNIIKLLGAGRVPRRFMVLEWLEGGSLNSVLQQNQVTNSFSSLLFHKPSFTYVKLLLLAKCMAEALDYLHFKAHLGASLIHRDLKPDNVGFTADGIMKLFDFGLITCVKARQHTFESYKMTGYTGSLRYMAPEVALREPYTEKVDVYSFSIMLWQMAKDKVPFTGLGKKAFLEEVVVGGLRPKLDKTWPAGFCKLLTSCWQRDPEQRPSFQMILLQIDELIKAETNEPSLKRPSITGSVSKGRLIGSKEKSTDVKAMEDKKYASVSSWF